MPYLNSSAISRVEYDPGSRQMSIWFRETGLYTYFGVPEAIYLGLISAPSAGRYFNDNIEDRY